MEKITWNCIFREGQHTVGCPHKEWSKEDLQEALELMMKFEQSGLAGQVASEELFKKVKAL